MTWINKKFEHIPDAYGGGYSNYKNMDSDGLFLETSKYKIFLGLNITSENEVQFRQAVIMSPYFDKLMSDVIKLINRITSYQKKKYLDYTPKVLDMIHQYYLTKDPDPMPKNYFTCGECEILHMPSEKSRFLCVKRGKINGKTRSFLENCCLEVDKKMYGKEYPSLPKEIIELIISFCYIKPLHYLKTLPDPSQEHCGYTVGILPFGYQPTRWDTVQIEKSKLLTLYSLYFVTTPK